MVKGLDDKIFNVAVYAILVFCALLAIFPILYVVSVSITPFGEVLRNGGFILIPRDVTFSAYKTLLTQSNLPQAFKITVLITVVGTAINLILTGLMAYPLSRKNLPGRRLVLLMIVFTLIFSGGLIPTYLIVKSVGLIDSVWAMILPNAIWSFNVLIMKSFFEGLPEELFESARLDGAKEFRILFQIVAPLSIPVIMTIGLFYLVGHWNEFFQAIFYVTDRTLFPLQVIVREILMQSQQPLENADNITPTQTMQMASVMIASLPVLIVYPFIQKYFTKGMLLGSIKG
ncbi:carbohydrate ABC transporter permease [Cohnella sp. JJ-181]|uniref:carbohydrate ABC transporter permease n=1 Tax=Cohnella rhizoplanae TaxID=2974897 RepID=UPI0022FF7D7C|nr:carbohydrate ABC transporter permease [Cohnella sp. JJ-181]CAI6085494.1 L-arabinose transport system permease protein AraQ [Cohnella sp. JJ-181]